MASGRAHTRRIPSLQQASGIVSLSAGRMSCGVLECSSRAPLRIQHLRAITASGRRASWRWRAIGHSPRVRSWRDRAATHPVGNPFQLTAGQSHDEFIRRLYFAIAQAFIKHQKILYSSSRDIPNTDDVRAWLNSPIFRSGGGGGSALGFGLSSSHGSSPSTSAGFTEAGFKKCSRRLARVRLSVGVRWGLHLRSGQFGATPDSQGCT
jgi:hypothetical protein